MKGFEPVTLKWKGESYTVPAEGQLMLIAQIEDALTGGKGGHALRVLTQQGGPSFVRLSQAFGAALRHAGAEVTDEEIYLSMVKDVAAGDIEAAAEIQAAVMGLLTIVAPPVALSLATPASKKKSRKQTKAS